MISNISILPRSYSSAEQFHKLRPECQHLYILEEGQPKRVDPKIWLHWMKRTPSASLMLATERIGALTVNTFFRPIDYTLGSEDLTLFSTYIRSFKGRAISRSNFQQIDEAMKGHVVACQIAKQLQH